jgi:hypothetical protein
MHRICPLPPLRAMIAGDCNTDLSPDATRSDDSNVRPFIKEFTSMTSTDTSNVVRQPCRRTAVGGAKRAVSKTCPEPTSTGLVREVSVSAPVRQAFIAEDEMFKGEGTENPLSFAVISNSERVRLRCRGVKASY